MAQFETKTTRKVYEKKYHNTLSHVQGKHEPNIVALQSN